MGEGHRASGGRPQKKRFSAGDPRLPSRTSGVMKPGGRTKPGAGSKKPGKVVSFKNRIRALERLLKKEGLADKVRQRKEKELADLHEQRNAHQRSLREQKLEKRYHRVKFFERVKIERRLKALEAEAARLAAEGRSFPLEREQELRGLRADMQYVKHFPKGEKYVSLLKDAEDAAAQAELDAKRERLRALVRRNVAEMALVTQADEGAALARSLPSEAPAAETPGASDADDFFIGQDDSSDSPSLDLGRPQGDVRSAERSHQGKSTQDHQIASKKASLTPSKQAPSKEAPSEQVPAKQTPAKDTPSKEAPAKQAPSASAPLAPAKGAKPTAKASTSTALAASALIQAAASTPLPAAKGSQSTAKAPKASLQPTAKAPQTSTSTTPAAAASALGKRKAADVTPPVTSGDALAEAGTPGHKRKALRDREDAAPTLGKRKAADVTPLVAQRDAIAEDRARGVSPDIAVDVALAGLASKRGLLPIKHDRTPSRASEGGTPATLSRAGGRGDNAASGPTGKQADGIGFQSGGASGIVSARVNPRLEGADEEQEEDDIADDSIDDSDSDEGLTDSEEGLFDRDEGASDDDDSSDEVSHGSDDSSEEGVADGDDSSGEGVIDGDDSSGEGGNVGADSSDGDEGGAGANPRRIKEYPYGSGESNDDDDDSSEEGDAGAKPQGVKEYPYGKGPISALLGPLPRPGAVTAPHLTLGAQLAVQSTRDALTTDSRGRVGAAQSARGPLAPGPGSRGRAGGGKPAGQGTPGRPRVGGGKPVEQGTLGRARVGGGNSSEEARPGGPRVAEKRIGVLPHSALSKREFPGSVPSIKFGKSAPGKAGGGLPQRAPATKGPALGEGKHERGLSRREVDTADTVSKSKDEGAAARVGEEVGGDAGKGATKRKAGRKGEKMPLRTRAEGGRKRRKKR